MELLADIAFYLGVIAYSVASTLFFIDLVRPESGMVTRLASPALFVAALAHATHIVAASLFSHICPVESIHFVLSSAALIAVGAFLVLRVRRRIHAIGALIAPLGLTFMVAAQFVGAVQPSSEVPRSVLALHVTASVLGVGLFLLAGAAGGFYLAQQRWLKVKRVVWLSRKLPTLDALDTTGHRLLLTGFPLLTLGVITGGVFLNELSSMSGVALARALLGYAAWVLVAFVLAMRALAGWRGRRAAYGTLAGVLCILAVITVYIVRPGGGAL